MSAPFLDRQPVPLVDFLQFHLAVEFGDHITVVLSPQSAYCFFHSFDRFPGSRACAIVRITGTRCRSSSSPYGRYPMNENELKGNWQVVKGKVREKWGKLTDQDIDVIAGKRDQLVGKLRERYGHAQGESERLVKEFEDGPPRTNARPPKRP